MCFPTCLKHIIPPGSWCVNVCVVPDNRRFPGTLKNGQWDNLRYGIEIMKIGSIVIHCYEFDRMLAFWQEALHYTSREPSDGYWVVLRDSEGRGPNISLQRISERRAGKRSRLHLDLYTTDRKGEVERLIKIGAIRYPWRHRPGSDFVVLEDPDGNLFCVVQVAG